MLIASARNKVEITANGSKMDATTIHLTVGVLGPMVSRRYSSDTQECLQINRDLSVEGAAGFGRGIGNIAGHIIGDIVVYKNCFGCFS